MYGLTAWALVIAVCLNLFAGFLALFPGMLEAGLANGATGGSGNLGLNDLAATAYGRWAIALLVVGGLQVTAPGALRPLGEWGLAGGVMLGALALATAGVEIWGLVSREGGYVLNAPGLLAAALSAFLAQRTAAQPTVGVERSRGGPAAL